MTIAKPENRTPREWAREWLIRADLAGAEASASDVVEVIVTEAVAYERERHARITEVLQKSVEKFLHDIEFIPPWESAGAAWAQKVKELHLAFLSSKDVS